MRELFLWLAKVLLLAFMALYAAVVWVVNTFGGFLCKKLDALDMALLIAGADRRTRNERKIK